MPMLLAIYAYAVGNMDVKSVDTFNYLSRAEKEGCAASTNDSFEKILPQFVVYFFLVF